MRVFAVIAALIVIVGMGTPGLSQGLNDSTLDSLEDSLQRILSPIRVGNYDYAPNPIPPNKKQLLEILSKIEGTSGVGQDLSDRARRILFRTLLALGMYELNVRDITRQEHDNKVASSGGGAALRDAEHYFLRAALVEPGRPEAYIALSYVENEGGIAAKSDYYEFQARLVDGMSQRKNQCPNPDLVALSGEKQLQRGNYATAALIYARALNDAHSGIGAMDSFFQFKFSQAVQQGHYPCLWVPPLLSLLRYGNENSLSPVVEKSVNALSQGLLERYPNEYYFVNVRELVNRVYYERALLPLSHTFRSFFSHVQDDQPFRLTALSGYTIPFQPRDGGWFKLAQAKGLSPLEAGFLDATLLGESEEDLKRREQMINRWQDIKKDVSGVVQPLTDPKQKAVALAQWLRDSRNRVLKDYDVYEGYSAQGILTREGEDGPYKGKFFCMTGAVTYALLGQLVANIPVQGYIVPGHAFAYMELDGKPYRVETTAEGSDLVTPLDARLKREYEPSLRIGLPQVGMVPGPRFVAYNYGNVAISALDNILLDEKYRPALVSLLKQSEYKDLCVIHKGPIHHALAPFLSKAGAGQPSRTQSSAISDPALAKRVEDKSWKEVLVLDTDVNLAPELLIEAWKKWSPEQYNGFANVDEAAEKRQNGLASEVRARMIMAGFETTSQEGAPNLVQDYADRSVQAVKLATRGGNMTTDVKTIQRMVVVIVQALQPLNTIFSEIDRKMAKVKATRSMSETKAAAGVSYEEYIKDIVATANLAQLQQQRNEAWAKYKALIIADLRSLRSALAGVMERNLDREVVATVSKLYGGFRNNSIRIAKLVGDRETLEKLTSKELAPPTEVASMGGFYDQTR